MSCCWMVGVGMTDFVLNVSDEEFVRGVREGRKSERERLAAMLEIEAERHQQLLLTASAEYLLGLSKTIKGKNKNE